MRKDRGKREITNISEMFLFLLSYDLFLSSSFFSCFISCSVVELAELCCFPLGQAPAGALLAGSEGCRTASSIPWAGWTPQSPRSGLGEVWDGLCPSAPSMEATTELPQAWQEDFLCSLLPLGKKKGHRYSRVTKEGVHSSFI